MCSLNKPLYEEGTSVTLFISCTGLVIMFSRYNLETLGRLVFAVLSYL